MQDGTLRAGTILRDKIADLNIEEAVRVYDEKIKSFVTGLSLDEIKNIIAVMNIGLNYLICLYSDDYYTLFSPAEIYKKETKSDYFRDKRGYYNFSDKEWAKEFHCNNITECYTLHDRLVTGLKILRYI